MGRKSRRGGQYLSNVGYSDGYTTPYTTEYLRGTDVNMANPVPFAATRTMEGGDGDGLWGKLTSWFSSDPSGSAVAAPVATEAAPYVSPDAVPEAAPYVSPDAVPEAAPEAAPEAVPEAGGGRFRRQSRGGFRRRSKREGRRRSKRRRSKRDRRRSRR